MIQAGVIEQLLQLGLLEDSDLPEVGDETITGQHLDASRLIQDLTANGRLTPFQAAEIEAGRALQLRLGNYLLLSKLGEGGMGTVYKALHLRMQRVVALKTLKPECVSNEFIERFYREARAAARLNHPHAVAAYDADEFDLRHYLVMEFVDGENLSAAVKRDGPMSVAQAVSAIRQAAEALAYAHQFGIVHRDVKPANLLRDAAGTTKLTDLGLVRWSGDTVKEKVQVQAELTQAGTGLGTVDFMSPEQAVDASAVDHRTDIYSLGCTLWFVLTGGPVYQGSSLMKRLVAHRESPVPSLLQARADVPPALDELFQKMVAKHPDDRFQSMEEVIAALKQLEASNERSTEASQPLSELTVFAVEPSSFQRRVLQKYLHDIGVDDVHFFQSAEETLEEVRQLRPQVVVTSYQLPDSSGIAFLQRLRDDLRWSMMPVVLLTSDPLPADQVQFIRDSRAVALIEKPFKPEQLAAALQTAVAESNSEPTAISGLDALRVLIVDDSSVARRRMEQTLTELGFQRFMHAEDGREAVDAISSRTFELVVTDYNMPEMNGHELVDWLRHNSQQPHLPVIMCTTEYDPTKLAAVYQLGVSAICNKSFERELVRNVIIRLFK